MQIAIVILLSIIAFLILVLVECNENSKDAFNNVVAGLIILGIILAALVAAGSLIIYLFF